MLEMAMRKHTQRVAFMKDSDNECNPCEHEVSRDSCGKESVQARRPVCIASIMLTTPYKFRGACSVFKARVKDIHTVESGARTVFSCLSGIGVARKQ